MDTEKTIMENKILYVYKKKQKTDIVLEQYGNIQKMRVHPPLSDCTRDTNKLSIKNILWLFIERVLCATPTQQESWLAEREDCFANLCLCLKSYLYRCPALKVNLSWQTLKLILFLNKPRLFLPVFCDWYEALRNMYQMCELATINEPDWCYSYDSSKRVGSSLYVWQNRDEWNLLQSNTSCMRFHMCLTQEPVLL